MERPFHGKAFNALNSTYLVARASLGNCSVEAPAHHHVHQRGLIGVLDSQAPDDSCRPS